MQAAAIENRLPTKRHHAREDYADLCTSQKHDLPDIKNLRDVFYDGIIGGNHRHCDDHE